MSIRREDEAMAKVKLVACVTVARAVERIREVAPRMPDCRTWSEVQAGCARLGVELAFHGDPRDRTELGGDGSY